MIDAAPASRAICTEKGERHSDEREGERKEVKERERERERHTHTHQQGTSNLEAPIEIPASGGAQYCLHLARWGSHWRRPGPCYVQEIAWPPATSGSEAARRAATPTHWTSRTPPHSDTRCTVPLHRGRLLAPTSGCCARRRRSFGGRHRPRARAAGAECFPISGCRWRTQRRVRAREREGGRERESERESVCACVWCRGGVGGGREVRAYVGVVALLRVCTRTRTCRQQRREEERDRRSTRRRLTASGTRSNIPAPPNPQSNECR